MKLMMSVLGDICCTLLVPGSGSGYVVVVVSWPAVVGPLWSPC